ncbi:MAG: hypothetical protein K8823_1492 [Cenarchaeum symbiont of Oopsacas minuta]|nr:hypothetical protein [Cenarchaeum symbiont of Oopsacas minuta]
MDYATKYPKTIKFTNGKKIKIKINKDEVEHLHVVVRRNIDELVCMFKKEGFTGVKFEHKKVSQIGKGLNLKLKRPWEMHIRFIDMKKGLVAIQGEVEVSRDYLQHLFCQSTPVIYEIENVLKKNLIDYRIWNSRIGSYVISVLDNYAIKLARPNIPVFAWKPMVYVIGCIGTLYLCRYLFRVF